MSNYYKPTIGLEIHLALNTKKKLFSNTENHFEINNFSLFDCATPGVLPVLNKEPVEQAIAFGLAVGADVQKESYFERKHYFYPDLPIGYQITQQHKPIIIGGSVQLSNGNKVIIEHAHLECDAAKSIHEGYSTFIDISRASSALLEIVSTPCIHSAEDASNYAKEIHQLGMYLGICDGKLEEGSFRVDASVSVSNNEKLGTRVEIKNISSFKFLETAINYEIERQTQLIQSGGQVVMETRLFQEKDMSTQSMRNKETVDEYRYLYDPDIPALVFDEKLIDKVKKEFDINFFNDKNKLFELLKDYSFNDIDFVTHKKMWQLFLNNKDLQIEKVAKLIHYWLPAGLILDKNVLMELIEFSPAQIKEILEKYSLNNTVDIKTLFPEKVNIEKTLFIIDEVLIAYPQQVNDILKGQEKLLQFIVGKTISSLKSSGQPVDPSMLKTLIIDRIKSKIN